MKEGFRCRSRRCRPRSLDRLVRGFDVGLLGPIAFAFHHVEGCAKAEAVMFVRLVAQSSRATAFPTHRCVIHSGALQLKRSVQEGA